MWFPYRPGKGLSPRVRGNLRPSTSEGENKRSIPACAGEPPWSGAAQPWAKVYPRVCGGTASLVL